jgi:hypothetical protein
MTLVQCRRLRGGFDVDIHSLINSKDKYARIFKAPIHIGHGEVRLQSDCVATPEFLKDWRFLLVGLRWWLRVLRSDDK